MKDFLYRLLTSAHRGDDLALTNRALMIALVVGFAIIFERFFLNRWTEVATASMWASACVISGAAVGFLFGIPRVVQGATELKPMAPAPDPNLEEDNSSSFSAQSAGRNPLAGDYRQEVNSNLIEISDWLTKIIVGLGLVNLQKVPELLARTALTLARGLGEKSNCTGEVPCGYYAFASALIVAFSVLGFFIGYLYTRLFLAGAFSRADRGISNLLASTNRIIKEERPKGVAQGSDEVAAWEVRAAERVSELPQAQNLTSIVSTLQRLGSEYDSIRSELPSGEARTRRMRDVLVRMRVLALAGYSELARFTDSASPGNRLVAVAMLQVQPNPGYFRWLLDRISLEKPFIVYQAIEAFRRAAEASGKPYNEALRELLYEWLRTDKAKQMLDVDNDRARLLRAVLRQLDISAQ